MCGDKALELFALEFPSLIPGLLSSLPYIKSQKVCYQNLCLGSPDNVDIT